VLISAAGAAEGSQGQGFAQPLDQARKNISALKGRKKVTKHSAHRIQSR